MNQETFQEEINGLVRKFQEEFIAEIVATIRQPRAQSFRAPGGRPPDPNGLQAQVLETIKQSPGIDFSALRLKLGGDQNYLSQCLLRLRNTGRIRAGGSPGAPRKYIYFAESERSERVGQNGMQARVLRAIANNPGLQMAELLTTTGASSSSVNTHVRRLTAKGAIRSSGKRGNRRYFVKASG